MALTRLLQVKISEELYSELILEAMLSGLTVAQVARLRLSNKKIIDKSELDNRNNKTRFRSVQEGGIR
jgi:hypothetical protein